MADAGWRVRIMALGWGPKVSWPIPHGKNGVHRIPPPPFGLGEPVQPGEGGRSVSRWEVFAAEPVRPSGTFVASRRREAFPQFRGRVVADRLWPTPPDSATSARDDKEIGPERHQCRPGPPTTSPGSAVGVHVPGPLLNKYSGNSPTTASEINLPLFDSQQESPT